MKKAFLKMALTGVIILGYSIILLSPGNCETMHQRKSLKIVKLPEPEYDCQVSIEKALLKRRSVRNYSKTPLALSEISQLLWAAQGLTSPGGFRTAPSAGALYPLELYIVAGNISNLSPGIYKYNPRRHQLVKIVEGDKRR